MTRVVSIQRFSIHDGPGIRTTVFLQGCPLHCPWCANPESQPTTPVQRHARPKCFGCMACVDACLSGCIQPGPDGCPVFDRNSCAGCGACERACPQHLEIRKHLSRAAAIFGEKDQDIAGKG